MIEAELLVYTLKINLLAKKCGHMGGKVLVPTQEAVQKLCAARLAADIAGVPSVILQELMLRLQTC